MFVVMNSYLGGPREGRLYCGHTRYVLVTLYGKGKKGLVLNCVPGGPQFLSIHSLFLSLATPSPGLPRPLARSNRSFPFNRSTSKVCCDAPQLSPSFQTGLGLEGMGR